MEWVALVFLTLAMPDLPFQYTIMHLFLNFTHSFNTQLLSTQSVPGTVLGGGQVAPRCGDSVPYLVG